MLQQMSLQNKILCASFGIFLVFYYLLNHNSDIETQKKEEPQSADTFIPAGHVLVPIQIENGDALGAVMGPFAVVDLYAEVSGHSTLIAEKVKLIRAPLNPKQFAVLVTENLSAHVMQIKVPFSVLLQNRNSFKAHLEKNLLLDASKKTSVTALVPKNNIALPARTPVVRKTLSIEYYEKNRL